MPTHGQQYERRLKNARFCPWCGTNSLVRDQFGDWENKLPAFICSVCHAGFTLSRSPRAEFALELFGRERRCRPKD
jgi:hypothetical protein